jgi:lipopolysaccharide export system protein LptA
MERGLLPAFGVMLGAVLVTMVMFGSSHAQTPPNALTPMQVTADSIMRVGNVMQLRGNVEIRRGGSVLRADGADVIGNADVTAASGGVELRGNVRLTSEDAIGIAIRRR